MYDSITVLPPSVEGLILGGDDEVDGDVASADSWREGTDEELPDDSVIDESEEELIIEDEITV
jgi:hypothetical protein